MKKVGIIASNADDGRRFDGQSDDVRPAGFIQIGTLEDSGAGSLETQPHKHRTKPNSPPPLPLPLSRSFRPARQVLGNLGAESNTRDLTFMSIMVHTVGRKRLCYMTITSLAVIRRGDYNYGMCMT